MSLSVSATVFPLNPPGIGLEENVPVGPQSQKSAASCWLSLQSSRVHLLVWGHEARVVVAPCLGARRVVRVARARPRRCAALLTLIHQRKSTPALCRDGGGRPPLGGGAWQAGDPGRPRSVWRTDGVRSAADVRLVALRFPPSGQVRSHGAHKHQDTSPQHAGNNNHNEKRVVIAVQSGVAKRTRLTLATNGPLSTWTRSAGGGGVGRRNEVWQTRTLSLSTTAFAACSGSFTR